MKKFCVTVYLVIMALCVITMSGCGGSSNKPSSNNTDSQSAQSRSMILSTNALKRGGKYSLFRGDRVTVKGTNAKYYLAPVTRGSETITMNLEFADAVSQDLPFVITEAGDDTNILFSYNPKGTGIDTTTPSVTRWGGGTQQLKYTNLTLAGSSVILDDSDVIDIVLKSDGTATAAGTSIPSYNYVWHADPQHPAQYWTLGMNGTDELDADAYEAAIEAAGTNNGLYIAHDIRYTPSGLGFSTSQTAKKDEDTEYVVYYDSSSSAVAKAIAALGTTYGAEYSTDKYIFATLPMSNGAMGGGTPGEGTMPSGDRPGTPPSGDTRLPVMGSVLASATDDSSIAAVSTMTHSASDAYNNPVLHITEAGTYRISGTWNGQIWVEVGTKATHQVAIILNGVTVKCTVAPALVFYKVYKWAEDNGYDDQSTLSANNLWRNIGAEMISSDGNYDVGAIVQVADGTTNSFTGANTYRILELCPKLDDNDNPKYTGSNINIGTDIGQQEKMYKLDSAFHSRRTMVIGGGEAGTGTLNITSTTYEGLGSEMHMLIDGGNISVTATDDGVNVNEDNVSVFQMDSGTLTVSSTNGDGVDSNGWISVNGGTLDVTAGQSSTGNEAGLDADNDIYISSSAKYTYHQANSGGGTTPGGDVPSGTTSGDQSGNTGNTDTGNNNTDNTGNTDTGNNNTGNNDTTTYSIIPVAETTATIDSASKFIMFPKSSTIETDTEGSRSIASSSETFELVHRVNDFAGITVK